jgi:predicted chitinase
MIRTMLTFLLLAPLAMAQSLTVADLDALRAEHRAFLDALAQVESGGNDAAVGDGGKAIGRMQIWEIYHTDAVAHAPAIGGEYADCKGKAYAERVVVAYLHRYGKKALADKDWERLSRIHNGGPSGHRKRATIKYWRKVEKALAAD